MSSTLFFKQMTPIWALCPDANGVLLTIVLQGARVWLRHKEQLLPSTVSSCDDSSLVFTTDYGKVRTSFFPAEALMRPTILFKPSQTLICPVYLHHEAFFIGLRTVPTWFYKPLKAKKSHINRFTGFKWCSVHVKPPLIFQLYFTRLYYSLGGVWPSVYVRRLIVCTCVSRRGSAVGSTPFVIK